MNRDDDRDNGRPRVPPGDDEGTVSVGGAGSDSIAPTISGTGPRPSQDLGGPQPVSIEGYRIIRELGRGGMGVVWEAEQERPKRRVALKVMRRDHQVDELHARMFQREAETLARLKHPNIAAIYASGHTDEGHDFFAMELVSGETLGHWLAGRPQVLDGGELELRLRLFGTICDAVHYAHQRGVIHRDLKPSNIVVSGESEASAAGTTQSAAGPVVKILDFGLARITDSDLAATLLSEVGTIKGTLQYMSPEQARGDIAAIDVRSDVYALGIILYELLAGARPYDVSRSALAEAVRVISEDPPRPLKESWAGSGRPDPDLETIIGKALEKDMERRYGSAAALGEDVGRYLASQPILARPPSALYQVRKFAGRNRALVGGLAAALVMLVVFAVTMTVQAERVRREAERANREAATAREVSEFLIGLFDRSDPTISRGEDLTARQILDSGAERIEALDGQPRTQAAFMETMGRVFTTLGEFERAEPLLERAVDIRSLAPGDDLALAGALHHRAVLLDLQGHYEEAEEPIRRAVEIRERRLGDHVDLGDSLNTLGNVLWHQGRLDEAEVVHRRALELRRRILPPDHTDIGQSLHNLGALRYFASDLAEAERLWRRSAEIEEAAHGPDDWNLATSLHTLAIVCSDQGRYDEALELELRSLAIREKVLGPEHPHVALSLTTLGNIYRETGRAGEAEPLIRRAVSIMEAATSPTYGEVLWMRRSLASTLVALERFAEAEAELASLIETIETASLDDELPPTLRILGELRARQLKHDEAEAAYLEAAAVLEESSPDDPYRGLVLADLARLYRDTGRLDEAEAAFRRAAAIMEEGWGPSDPDYLQTAAELEELATSTAEG